MASQIDNWRNCLPNLAAALIEKIQKHLCKQDPPMLEIRCQKEAGIKSFNLDGIDSTDAPERVKCDIDIIAEAFLPVRHDPDEAADQLLEMLPKQYVRADDLEKLEREP